MQGKSYLFYDVEFGLGQPITSGDTQIIKDVCYKCLYRGYIFDPDNPTVLKVEDNIPVEITRSVDKYQSIHHPDERLGLLKEVNDKELSRLRAEVKSWDRKLSKYPDDIQCKSMVQYYKMVVLEFEKWYTDNDLNMPSEDLGSSFSVAQKSQDEVGEAAKSPTKRKILSPGEREKLNGAIYDAVQNFIDEGQGTQEQAFHHVANNSAELLKESLTKGQIAGRYKRMAKYNK